MVLPYEIRDLKEDTVVCGDIAELEAYIIEGRALRDWFTLRGKSLRMLDEVCGRLEEWSDG